MKILNLGLEITFRGEKRIMHGKEVMVPIFLGGTQPLVNETEGMFQVSSQGPISGTIFSFQGNFSTQTLEGGTIPFSRDGIPCPIDPATGKGLNAFNAHANGTYPGWNTQILIEYWVTPVSPAFFKSRDEFVKSGGFTLLSYIIKQPSDMGATIHLPINASINYELPSKVDYWVSTRITVGAGAATNLEQQLHIFTT